MKTRMMYAVIGALTVLATGSVMAGDDGTCPPENVPPDFEALGCMDCSVTDYLGIGQETQTLGGGDSFVDSVTLETNISGVVGFQIKFDYGEENAPDSSWASDVQVAVTGPDGDQYIIGGLTNLPDADEFWSFQGSISDPPGDYGCTDADVFIPSAWLADPLNKGTYSVQFTNDWGGDPTANIYSNVKIRFVKQMSPAACCFPDESCQDFLPGICAEMGGVTPDPAKLCAETDCTTAFDRACCFPNGTCQDLQDAECLDAGGTPQEPDTQCATTECPQITFPCCFPDGSCQNLEPQDCTQLGGIPQLDKSRCDDIVCPAQQACCFPNGTCQDLFTADCLDAGGTPQEPGTQCATTECPQITFPCCFPDGSCQNLEPEDCTQMGGFPQLDKSRCDDIVCPVMLQACCFQDGSCDDLMPADCIGDDGVPQGEGTMCDTTVCIPILKGACCFADMVCLVVREDECQQLGGRYQGDNTVCDPNPCPATGACCLPGGFCEIESEENCLGMDGEYEGDDTICKPDTCEPRGACCFPDGSCTDDTGQSECNIDLGGTWQGDDTVCTPELCPPPKGACCLDGGACTVVPEEECAALSGRYQGDMTVCSPGLCPFGACCFEDGTCQELSQPDCAEAGGAFQGDGTQCNPCPQPDIGVCCLPDGSCDDQMNEEMCTGLGGQFQGIGSLCDATTCDGACCLPDGTCTVTGLDECEDIIGGAFQGARTDCETTECPGACCLPPPPPPAEPESCCENGKIVVLTLRYTGDDCSATSHSQDPGKVSCDDFAPLTDLVFIRATDQEDPDDVGGIIWFAGDVALDGEFSFDAVAAGEDHLKSSSFFHVFDQEGGTLLQSVEFHTSCSQPLFTQDQFGCGRVVGCIGEDQALPGEPMTCVDTTLDVCTALEGVYQGFGTSCLDAPCVGACCLPPPSGFDCDGKVVQMTVIWDGVEPVRIRAYDGDVGGPLLADIDNIQIGDDVTVGPLNGPNDFYFEVFEAGTSTLIGLSKFHRSCSDDEMDGPEDCGNREGNGKSNDPDLINDWLLEGLVDESGASFSCGLPGGEDCAVVSAVECSAMGGSFQGLGTDCADVDCTPPGSDDCCENGKIVVLTLRYTGDDCSATSHSQDPSKVSCDDFAPLTDVVFIRATDQEDPDDVGGIIWFAGDVALDGEFDLDAVAAGEAHLKSASFFHVFDQEGGTLLQSVEFHTSCSQPLFVGNQFGCGLVVGCVGEDESPAGNGSNQSAPGDINSDGSVNITDLLFVLVSWGPCLECVADLDGSGAVGFADLLILLDNWG